MEVAFILADKSPLLNKDAKVVEKRVRITSITSNVIRYCALKYIAILLQRKYRHGLGEHGKLAVGGDIIEFEEIT